MKRRLPAYDSRGFGALLVLLLLTTVPVLSQTENQRTQVEGLLGLSGLPLLKNSQTRSISAENPTGEQAAGAKAVPQAPNAATSLGTGWKVRPDIDLPRRTTVTFAEIHGPGVIQHIWMTVSERAYRDCVLRFYWDGEAQPSVESPLGDFFANAHGLRHDVN